MRCCARHGVGFCGIRSGKGAFCKMVRAAAAITIRAGSSGALQCMGSFKMVLAHCADSTTKGATTAGEEAVLREAAGASGSAPAPPRPLLVKKELHPILVKGQLRRFGTPPVGGGGGGDGAAGPPLVAFQAQNSWEHIDLTPPARSAFWLLKGSISRSLII